GSHRQSGRGEHGRGCGRQGAAAGGADRGRFCGGRLHRRYARAGRRVFRANRQGIMNPELQRNLWLEASPFRLTLIAGLVLLALAAVSVAPRGLGSTSGVALGLYWFFAVLWGTRSAALSVVAEIRERTWDSQKLSSIGPWEMVWGKLFGATAAN